MPSDIATVLYTIILSTFLWLNKLDLEEKAARINIQAVPSCLATKSMNLQANTHIPKSTSVSSPWQPGISVVQCSNLFALLTIDLIWKHI